MPYKYNRRPKRYAENYIVGDHNKVVRIGVSFERGEDGRINRVVARLVDYYDRPPSYGLVPRFDGYVIGREWDEEYDYDDEVRFAIRTNDFHVSEDFGRSERIIGTMTEVYALFVAWAARLGKTEMWVLTTKGFGKELDAFSKYKFKDASSIADFLNMSKKEIKLLKSASISRKKDDLRGQNAWFVCAIVKHLYDSIGQNESE